MRFIRLLAIGAICATSGLNMAQAQSLRKAQSPAEYPPSSYKSKQYVDSRGCIYIRAGIDGNVTWVPRVTRERKQVCGYKPSLAKSETVAAAPASPAAQPTLITIEPVPAPATAPAPKPRTQPAPVQTAAPRRTAPAPTPAAAPRTEPAPQVRRATAATAPPISALFGVSSGRKPSPGPEPTLYVNPPPKQSKPKQTDTVQVRVTSAPSARAPSPAPKPTVYVNPAPARVNPATAPRSSSNPATGTSACPGASALSQKYINKPGRYEIRCGPQAEPPVTVVSQPREQSAASPVLQPRGTATVAVAGATGSQTRILPRHVYDARQNTLVANVPDGYKPVWTDGRLNPRRAERTSTASVIRRPVVPSGYKVAWDDERLNRQRGMRSSQGDAQTTQIWSDTVPRKLLTVPTDREVITLSGASVAQPASPIQPLFAPDPVVRMTSRSAAPSAASPAGSRHEGVAPYGSDASGR